MIDEVAEMRVHRTWSVGLALGLVGCVEINPAFYADTQSGGSMSTDGPTTSSDVPVTPARTCEDLGGPVVFCADFEDGGAELWDDYDENPDEMNVLTLDAGPRDAHDNHVMRLRIPPGEGGVDLVKLLPGYYDELYTRWYIKYEGGYDFDVSSLGSGLHAGSRDLLGATGVQPTGDDRFAVIMGHTTGQDARPTVLLDYRGMYQQCDSPDACWRDRLPCLRDESICTNPAHRVAPDPPAPLQTDQWYCVEMHVNAGTPVGEGADADGLVEMWLEDTLVGRWDDLWLRTDDNLQLTVLWILLWYGQDHGDEGVLYDDIVVSRERVGCL